MVQKTRLGFLNCTRAQHSLGQGFDDDDDDVFRLLPVEIGFSMDPWL